MHSLISGWHGRSRAVLAMAALVGWIAIEPAPSAAVRPPKLDYTMTTLENGLKVVLLEDHSTPIVHTELWYHVGSKNEKKGRTGFAHLFEHMMFKGSQERRARRAPVAHLAAWAGRATPTTNEDATVFWQTVPGAVPADGAVARSRSHGVAADRREGLHRPSARWSRKSGGCASRTSRTAG